MLKKLFRKFIEASLGLNAKILLFRKKPEVIAITGSAGKTSAKEFLRSILELDCASVRILAEQVKY